MYPWKIHLDGRQVEEEEEVVVEEEEKVVQNR